MSVATEPDRTGTPYRRLEMPIAAREPVLALGAESKAVICLQSDHDAYLSPVLGDLTLAGAYRDFVRMVEAMQDDLQIEPVIVAHDLHPHFMSTRFARSLGLPTIAVQHHHAHIASVLAEKGEDRPVVGVACDGLGYGSDGAIWGCEILRCDAESYDRVAHLSYFPLVGGDAAARAPWRAAASLVGQALGADWRRQTADLFAVVAPKDLDTFERALGSHLNAPPASSLGRVFDAVSFLLGLAADPWAEGKAARALEAAVAGAGWDPYPYDLCYAHDAVEMSLSAAIRAILDDLRLQKPPGLIAGRFHETVARMLAAAAMIGCEAAGANRVAVSGGCFANQRLRASITTLLAERGTLVMTNDAVPCGDAGIALGQAYCAAARLGSEP